MERFNEFIDILSGADFDVTATPKEVEKFIKENLYKDEFVERLFHSIIPIQRFKLLFPISSYDEFPPQEFEFRSNNGVKPSELFELISNFYNTKLTPEQIDLYNSLGYDLNFKGIYLHPNFKGFTISHVVPQYVSGLQETAEESAYLLKLD